MRKDFNKVLTEDPRRGSDRKFREYRHAKGNDVFDDQFFGGKESMMTRRRIAKGERKRFGDLLGPLRGWVRKQVGRKWNDVYSEVCEHFDRRSQIKDHVHVHILRDFVDTKVKLIDGKVYVINRWGGWREVSGTQKRPYFYVHPGSGILCMAADEKEAGHAARAEAERAERLNKVFRVHDRDAHLYFDDGQWWVYRLADIPEQRQELVCPSWSSFEVRIRWAKMTHEERLEQGVWVWVRPEYHEVKPPTIEYSRWQYVDKCPTGRYYYIKQAASRKILKAHGLTGTAEFKEKKASHRERSKWCK